MALSASWIATCVIAYIRDSLSGLSAGAMHAASAASAAFAFHAVEERVFGVAQPLHHQADLTAECVAFEVADARQVELVHQLAVDEPLESSKLLFDCPPVPVWLPFAPVRLNPPLALLTLPVLRWMRDMGALSISLYVSPPASGRRGQCARHSYFGRTQSEHYLPRRRQRRGANGRGRRFHGQRLHRGLLLVGRLGTDSTRSH